MEQIKLEDAIGYADWIKIIFADKCVDILLENERHLNYTFGEVLEDAKRNGWETGTILLIAESPLAGKIFQYNNYWAEHGETQGYA